MGKDLYGADEFVIDSYKIREGKLSILEMEGKEVEELPLELLSEYKDVIHEGDVLQIILYHPKREDIVKAVATIGGAVGFRVTNGVIHLPDLSSIALEGLTLQEASEVIQKKYLEEIKDIEVYVTYKERKEGRVQLAGLVSISSLPVNGTLRLFDVLAQAKVPPDANLFKSYLVRGSKPLAVDMYKLLKEGDMSQNVVMRPGDKVYIAEPFSATVMVMGEVAYRRLVSVPNGFISLRETLAAAGGILFTGDPSYIQIIRGSIVKPKIYTISWEHVIHLPNDSLLLIPGDVVYVASKPITEWNRFISQLLPSFSGFEAVGNTCGKVGVIAP